MAQTGRSLAELASVVTRLPQVLINVRVADKAVTRADTVSAAVAAAEAQLGATGRVLLRPSGTEKLVRVMVEASSAETAQKIAESLAAEVRLASPLLYRPPAPRRDFAGQDRRDFPEIVANPQMDRAISPKSRRSAAAAPSGMARVWLVS